MFDVGCSQRRQHHLTGRGPDLHDVLATSLRHPAGGQACEPVDDWRAPKTSPVREGRSVCPDQAFDPFKEDLKAARTIVPRQVLRHASRAPPLLEIRDELDDACGRIDHLVRIPKSPPAQFTLHAFTRMWECADERLRLTDVPRLEFSAHDSNEPVIAPRSLAEFHELSLHLAAVGTVLISHHDEAHAWFTPGPELSRHALRRIALALVRDSLKLNFREEAGQQVFKQVRHRSLLQQEHELHHQGLAPSNRFCLHNSLG